MQTSRVATFAAVVAALSVLLMGIGPGLSMSGIGTPIQSFQIFGLGLLLGLPCLVLGAFGLFATRSGKGRGGRSRALFATLVGAAVPVFVLINAGDGPAINDITTSPDDPPSFVAALELPPNLDRDMAYPATFAAVQRAAYSDLAPIRLPLPPPEAFDLVLRSMQALGWTVTHRDRPGGALEAYETTRIFRFVDDVVVRIRRTPSGAIVDVRSKSRDGQGDIGANAARIRRLRDAISGPT